MTLARMDGMNVLDPSCEILASRAQSGDKQALEQLAERWWSRIRQWTFVEFGERPLMEDVAQDCLIKLFERIDRYDAHRPFAPWLRMLVRNCARDRLRKRKATGVMIELTDHRDPSRDLDLRAASTLVIQAFSSLTARQRQVIDLCDRQGLTSAKAAAELEIAPATARVLLHQARKRLRLKMLEDHADVYDLIRETA